jgi:hypothetical protein
VKPPTDRVLLARVRQGGESSRVWEAPLGVEVEETVRNQITLRRVLWGDVRLVTLHRARRRDLPAALLVIGAVVGLFVGSMSGYVVFVFNAALKTWSVFAALAALVWAWPVHVITVQGRRSRAILRLERTRDARDVFDRLCARVRREQDLPETPGKLE